MTSRRALARIRGAWCRDLARLAASELAACKLRHEVVRGVDASMGVATAARRTSDIDALRCNAFCVLFTCAEDVLCLLSWPIRRGLCASPINSRSSSPWGLD